MPSDSRSDRVLDRMMSPVSTVHSVASFSVSTLVQLNWNEDVKSQINARKLNVRKSGSLSLKWRKLKRRNRSFMMGK